MKAIIFDMDGVLVNTEPLHYKLLESSCSSFLVADRINRNESENNRNSSIF